ncbi:MAG: hypothetical protein C0606_17095 [Hyphomicrobiales bacterium]|nr:MAG: hypothetical protein C0606_17095 [Hyphomicrobiales bacterium]
MTIVRASTSSTNTEGNNHSDLISISGNGRYVVFTSEATNLIAGDTNNNVDIFLKDLATGELKRVSVDENGEQLRYSSTNPFISVDGRYVLYETTTSIVTEDVNKNSDIYLYDTQTENVELISKDNNGIVSNGHSYDASISNDGKYILYTSSGTNIIDNDINENSDAFIYNRETREVERIPVPQDIIAVGHAVLQASLSGDGTVIVFRSLLDNIDPKDTDTNALEDIFVYDRKIGEFERISVRSDHEDANGKSYTPSISHDGNIIVFESEATNLVDGITESNQIYVYDRTTDSVECVSLSADGEPANQRATNASISADGRYVTFESNASNLVDDDTNGSTDVFRYDRNTNIIIRITVDENGDQITNYTPGTDAVISADGSTVAFESSAPILADDTNHRTDIYVVGTLDFDTAPTIGNLDGDRLNYVSGSGPALLDQGSDATVTDDATDFSGGQLSISISAGADSTEDRLAIEDSGTGAGEIGTGGGNFTAGSTGTVTYAGIAIGTYTVGNSSPDLTVDLNGNATQEAVAALIAAITYENTDTTDPTTGERTVRVVLTDTDGRTSADSDVTVDVQKANTAPVVDNGISNQTTTAGEAFTLTVPTNAFRDDDVGDTLSYSATLESGDALPSWLTFNGTTFSGAPTSTDAGSYTIAVTADDANGGLVTTTFTLTVETAGGGDDTVTGGGGGDDTVTGGNGDDTVSGGDGDDTVSGGDGDDTVTGGGGDDTVDGGDGDDAVSGGDGNDSVGGGGGDDSVAGGDGDDTLGGGDGDDTVAGDDGDDAVTSGAGDDTVTGGDGDDTLAGDDGDDSVAGGSGDDSVGGGDGDDTVTGDGGNDTIDGGNGDDTLSGNDGSDTISGGNGNDVVRGGECSDFIVGGRGNDLLFGNRGDDQIFGQSGRDTINGGAGNDTIAGQNGDDVIRAGIGDDSISSGDGDDRSFGEGGNDRIFGNKGNDLLNGGSGRDFLNGGDGNDSLLGGDDRDRLLGGDGNDNIHGGFGDDVIFGQRGDDSLGGNVGDDKIDGGMGSDTLSGGVGRDTLIGGAGNDFLSGGIGHDVIRGGIGHDTALYAGSVERYQITKVRGGIKVTDKEGDLGTDIVTNVESISFSKSGVFDIDEFLT